MPESNTQTSNSPLDFRGPIEINRQADFAIDETVIRQVVSSIVGDAGFTNGSISIAVVDDPTIHDLNVRYLQHDYETDVLSFVLESDVSRSWLEGEVIVSCDTAIRVSAEYNWQPTSELLLYIIHGTLHLTGMDDATDQLRAEMQACEKKYLASVGLNRPAENPDHSGEDHQDD